MNNKRLSFVVPTCSDGVQNQDESDFDCGGLHCPKCLDLKGCNTASDCVSGVCSGNICQGIYFVNSMKYFI